MDEPNINGFIKWMENNKDEETGEYRIPRFNIIKNNKALSIREMTEDQIEECRYGRWWTRFPMERQIYQKYVNFEEEKIPEKYRKFIKKMKKIIPPEYKFTVKEYFEWIKNNKCEITGVHKKPRNTINKNGKTMKLNEMTKSEIMEVRLGRGFLENITERKICEEYAFVKIEDVPEEYREMIEIIKSTSVFSKYIDWRKNHFDEQTGVYRNPRLIITRNGKKVEPEEMTFEEKEETEIAYLWKRQSEEKKIIETYKYKELAEIPEIYIDIIKQFREVDGNLIKENEEIDNEIARMKLCAKKYVEHNIKTRQEISNKIRNLEEKNEEER